MNDTDKSRDLHAAESNLKAVKRTRIHEEIAQQIRMLIEEGKLKYGDQLPPERRLSEIFQVSRHSVREAIRTLEEQNVVQSRVGAGTFVIIEDGPSVEELLTRAILKEKDKLSEIFQFRRMIEPQMAAQAALKAEAQDIKELKSILERQKKATNDFHLMVELDQKFHLALARATKNSILLKVVERLNDILRESRVEVSQSRDRLTRSVKGHLKLLRAVEAGDPDAASAAMEDHLTQVEEIALKS